jgi:hypothetical protein
MPTLEEAQRCPKCDKPGEIDGTGTQIPGSRNKRLYIFCRNELCRWYDTSWVVDVKPDGSVPEPQIHRNPTFYQDPSADRLAREIEERLAAERDASLKPGGEVRNPFTQ